MSKAFFKSRRLAQHLKFGSYGQNACNERGYTWALMDQPEKALADYNSAIEIEPDHKKALINRCNIYRTLGEDDKHDAAIEKLIEYGYISADDVEDSKPESTGFLRKLMSFFGR